MPPDLTAVPTTSPLSLYRYRDGLYAVDLLTAALVELDFFTWLEAHPSTLEDVCQHFRIQPRPTDVMLTLFVARGYVNRDGETYRVTDMGREHLTAGSSWNLAPYYAAFRERPIVQDYLQVLRTGRPANWAGAPGAGDWHAAMETEAFARRFTAAMDCRGLYLGEALARALDLRTHQRLLDIGGGSGVYACTIAARHPHITATVLDQPPVDAIASARVAERGYADRVDVVAANFLTDGLPDGYDMHLFSNVLHDWDVPEVQQLLGASFRSLRPGGMLIVHDAFINATKTGPVPVAEYSTLLMHSSQGKCYATSEYERLMAAAGFDQFTFTSTIADRGVMTARRP